MAITIKKGADKVAAPKGREGNRNYLYTNHPDIDPVKWETYGRLDLDNIIIASLEDLTPAQVGQLRRRADLKAALDKGRSQCLVAIRQKQINLALAGSERMLIHAGIHFAGQDPDGPVREPENYEPTRHSWDAEFQKAMDGMRQSLEQETEDGE